jgi:hypothetical protein
MKKPLLQADFDNGEGDLRVPQEWRDCHNHLLKMDLLKDWIGLLNLEYGIACANYRQEMTTNGKDLL